VTASTQRKSRSTLSHVVLTELADVERLREEWHSLFISSRERNVFLHPTWVLTWARHFVRECDLFVVVVRAGAELVGLAPLRRHTVGWSVGPSVTRLLPVGSGARNEFNELPGILVAPGRTRSVLREVIGALSDHRQDWDWVDLSLGCDHGWFEPEWLDSKGLRPLGTYLHKATKPCVIMPLGSSWPDTASHLKRHIRRSVHRGSSLMQRTGRTAKFVIVDPAEVEAWVETLAGFYRARSNLVGKVHHSDHLADPRSRSFLVDVGQALTADGTFLPCLLRVDGEDVAAQLVLRAGEQLYFSLSGFDPRWWSENVATILMTECFRWGIDHGCTSANLSVGVDMSKLRWSEQIELHEEFTIIGTRGSSRAAFLLYWQLRSASEHHLDAWAKVNQWWKQTGRQRIRVKASHG
jgi:CelD/BcsL family acetyltransferase involved in cellulose biosynthesis